MMLTIERMSAICGLLQKNGVVRVDELAGRFHVSEMTIRRDLEKLEREGQLTRCHGGAVQKTGVVQGRSEEGENLSNLGAKRRIARYCFDHYIQENTMIYLDAGTTVLQLAKLLPARPGLTVVTNDVIIAGALVNSNTEVFVLGGNMQRPQGGIYDQMAENQLENYRVDMAFVSGLCMDDAFDVFSATANTMYFRRTVLNCARKTFLMMDASKFHKQSLFKMNNLADYTAVVTDGVLTKELASQAAQAGIQWITV